MASNPLQTINSCILASSILSLAGSLFTIVSFYLFEESRRCGRRILLCMSLADLGTSGERNSIVISTFNLFFCSCMADYSCTNCTTSIRNVNSMLYSRIRLAILSSFVVSLVVVFCFSFVSDPLERQ